MVSSGYEFDDQRKSFLIEIIIVLSFNEQNQQNQGFHLLKEVQPENIWKVYY